jgi:hypothetical protein
MDGQKLNNFLAMQRPDSVTSFDDIACVTDRCNHVSDSKAHAAISSGWNSERIGPISCRLAFHSRSVENFRVQPPMKRLPPRGLGKSSARARILAQWRGVDLGPLEKARAVAAKSAGELLPQVLVDLKLDTRRGDAEIVKVWNALIDPAVTAHAQPANLHKGTLFVNVDSSVWLTEIVRYRRKEILDRLQNSFGKTTVQKISFRIG